MKGFQKGIYVLPNLFTSASLFFGFYAIVRMTQIAIQGGENFRSCALAIIASGLCDMMDGRVARRTNTATKFGVEYDSLADLVAFGVAPALLVYLWALRGLGRIGWLASFLYLACGALRLARFNLQNSGVGKNFFQGLPIPMAALVISGSVLLWQGKISEDSMLFFNVDYRIYLLILTYLLAALMVSSIPYRSLKSQSFTTPKPFHSLFFLVVVIMIWAVKPSWMFFLLSGLYLLSGPFEQYVLPSPWKIFQRIKKKRRMNQSLNRMDQLTRENSVSSEPNVHPLRRS